MSTSVGCAIEKSIISTDMNNLTPNILITHNSKKIIIDAYNDSDPSFILYKLCKYSKITNDIYVFSSQISTYEQLISKDGNKSQFKLNKLVESYEVE